MAASATAACDKAVLSPKGEGNHRAASNSIIKYRADIDGMRAVAVLSVLAFHIGWSRFQGGFVGVDVFFVISGYLISSIIFAEISASRFSIVGFYERRIRRIFPALFAMLAVTTVAAVICLLPNELVDYARSLLAATCSASNFYFWQHSGYFDIPTSKPLLQTWSLAVEEQFYLSFPLFLILVRRLFSGRLRSAVVALFIASFIASCLVVVRSQDTAFYMPYTRAWELLLGTLLSLGIFPKLRSAVLRNIASVSGIGMILWSVLFYSQSTLFPGLSALLPCAGSALIIWAGEAGGSVVGSVLSLRPVVFVGLISYSLYLWHWPVVVLRKMGVLGGIGGISFGNRFTFLTAHRFDMFFEVILSLVLGALSWKFVEKPFRSGALRLSGRPLFALAGAVVALFVAVSTLIVSAQGLPGRFPARAVQIASSLDQGHGSRTMRVGSCFITTEYHFENYNSGTCLRTEKDEENDLLLGDSHSAMLWSSLATEINGVNVMQASTANCLPLLNPSGTADCKKMMSFIFQQYLPAHPTQGVFLAGRWDQNSLQPLTQTILWARQHHLHVVVFGPVPEYDAPLPRLLAYSIAWNEPELASRHLVADSGTLDAKMQRLASTTWHVPYISLYQEICRSGSCLEYADSKLTQPLMADDNHLSQAGADFVVRKLVDEGELK